MLRQPRAHTIRQWTGAEEVPCVSACFSLQSIDMMTRSVVFKQEDQLFQPMARAQSLWRNVWCSSHHCLNSRGNLVVFRSSQFGNTERSSKGLGSILSRSCRPARAGGTLHVFRHPHMHVPEPLCGSKVTVCSRVALLADILLY